MLQYKNNNFNDSTRNILLKYQHDGDFASLWKRELDVLTCCRKFKDIEDSPLIDPIIKTDFKNDLIGFFMTIVESRGEDFILTDIYPTFEIFPLYNGNIHLHSMIPLSPNRMLLLNHIMFLDEKTKNPTYKTMINNSKIKGNAIKPPKVNRNNRMSYNDDDTYVYKVQRLYPYDVKYINALFLNEAKIGVIFCDKERIKSSITGFNNRNDTKQNFKELEEIL